MKTPFVFVLGAFPGLAFSAVTYTTDSTSSLVGTFTFDLVNDSSGVGTTIANFPHFYLDFSGNGVYPSGETEFEVNDVNAPTILGRRFHF